MPTTTEITMIRLVERVGPVLAGRADARALREEILAESRRTGAPVVIDLADITTISPSFADELFGKLPSEIAPAEVEFENLSDHLAGVARVTRNGRS